MITNFNNIEKLIEILLNYDSNKFVVYTKDDTTIDKFCITFVDEYCQEF